MKTAAAVVTERGGRTCHAAIVARELGIPAVVGTGDATSVLRTGDEVTVSCAEGDVGRIYAGECRVADRDHRHVRPASRRAPRSWSTSATPTWPSRRRCCPVTASDWPAWSSSSASRSRRTRWHWSIPERVTDPDTRAAARPAHARLSRRRDFFVERLAEGVGTIAAAFYPRPVIVRMSDFKTNEYASLLGGARLRAARGEPDDRLPRRLALRPPGLRRGLCARVRAPCSVCARRWDSTTSTLMLPFCRRWRRPTGSSTGWPSTVCARGEHGLRDLRDVRDPQQRRAHR